MFLNVFISDTTLHYVLCVALSLPPCFIHNTEALDQEPRVLDKACSIGGLPAPSVLSVAAMIARWKVTMFAALTKWVQHAAVSLQIAFTCNNSTRFLSVNKKLYIEHISSSGCLFFASH